VQDPTKATSINLRLLTGAPLVQSSSVAFADAAGTGWVVPRGSASMVNGSSTVAYRGNYGMMVTAPVNMTSPTVGFMILRIPAGNVFNTAGYDTLSLAVNIGTYEGEGISIGLTDINGHVLGIAPLASYSPDGILDAYQWYALNIPLADLNATNASIYSIVVFISAPNGASFSFDEIQFTAAPAPDAINAVTASCSPTSVSVGGTAQCMTSVAITGNPDTSVIWSVNGVENGNSTVGTIDPTSNPPVYTAPSTVPNPATITITAMSVFDSTKSGSMTLTINPLSSSPFSSNARQAVVLEAFYALRTSHDGGCDQYIYYLSYNNCVSSWNFLNDNNQASGPLAMANLVPAFGIDASDWAVPSDTYYDARYDTGIPPSFYSDLATYGYSTAGGTNGSVGRGGQCVFFANNILYRSQSDQSTLNFATMMNTPTSSNPNPDPRLNPDPNLQDVQMGDVLFLYGGSGAFSVNHVAIVVNLYPGPDGIEAVDVIDSNYVPDNMPISSGREAIAKHSFCLVDNNNCTFYPNVQMIQGQGQEQIGYRIWTGTQYYHALYVPNQ
jgi:hypothetical protein